MQSEKDSLVCLNKSNKSNLQDLDAVSVRQIVTMGPMKSGHANTRISYNQYRRILWTQALILGIVLPEPHQFTFYQEKETHYTNGDIWSLPT